MNYFCFAFLSLSLVGFAQRQNGQQLPDSPAPPAKETIELTQAVDSPYLLETHRLSYFARDETGGLVLEEGLPVRAEKKYRFERIIHPRKTAIVLMAPWNDMASEHLNELHRKTIRSHILPLVRQALQNGHPVIAFTNDPDKVAYNTKFPSKLEELARKGAIEVLYFQDFDDDAFALRLRKKGTTSLIYTGFASNMAVIGARTGIIPMLHQGFKTYFVPEASAAMETGNLWDSRLIHSTTTLIISQWMAEIISYKDFMNAMKDSQSAQENE